MRAYKIPYSPSKGSFGALRRLTLDFPERGLSYLIVDCKEADLRRCAEEVDKPVELHAVGAEPPLLEIRVPGEN